MNLQDKAKALFELRQEINRKEEAHKQITDPLKAQRNALQAELISDMRQEGQLSARYSFATLTCFVRKTPHLIDETKAIQWLKENKLKREYTAVRVTDAFDTLMKQAVKEEREIDGVSVTETEFLSIRSADEEKREKRKVVIE